ncbi:hypothetical protein, partial [Bailinhaonella thermotolerans]|uniref:hypothetical protein n=1 Tax=Bailinhaonella thermotolerans TaxID=1070861 RepID=UPI001A8DA76D
MEETRGGAGGSDAPAGGRFFGRCAGGRALLRECRTAGEQLRKMGPEMPEGPSHTGMALPFK